MRGRRLQLVLTESRTCNDHGRAQGLDLASARLAGGEVTSMTVVVERFTQSGECRSIGVKMLIQGSPPVAVEVCSGFV